MYANISDGFKEEFLLGTVMFCVFLCGCLKILFW